jgi:hypothetical protein
MKRFVLLRIVVLGLSAAEGADPLMALQQRLGIPIVRTAVGMPVKTTHGAIAGVTASAAQVATQVAAHGPILAAAFGLYPRAVIQRTQRARIVWCNNLSFAGQRRSAVPDLENNVLYLPMNFPAARGSGCAGRDGFAAPSSCPTGGGPPPERASGAPPRSPRLLDVKNPKLPRETELLHGHGR